MTDRERKMIEGYLPSPPDPTLDMCEYYILDNNDRVQRVFIRHINPGELDSVNVYGVHYSATGNRFGGDDYGKTHKWDLYDNAEDCRNRTHMCYDGWERLRDLQREEGLI